jgi:prolyl oligopeptidase
MRKLSLLSLFTLAACAHPASAPTPSNASTAPAAPVAPAQPSGPPAARIADVAENIAGKVVHDPYRWMEGSDNAEFQAWMASQSDYAAAQLAHIPGRDALFEKIRKVGLGTGDLSNVAREGERVFYLAQLPGAQLHRLEWRDLTRSGDEAHVLVDPESFSEEGGHAGIDNFSVAPGGKLVAFNLSRGGAEVTEIHLRDVDTGIDRVDVIPRVWGEFMASWLPDGSGFFYTQMADAAPGADPVQNMRIKLHILGKPVSEDVLVFAAKQPGSFVMEPHEMPILWVPRGSSHMLLFVGGARASARYAVAPLRSLDRSGAGKTPWQKVADYDDGITDLELHDGTLYLLSQKDAPNRRVLSLPVGKPELARAKVAIEQEPALVVQSIAVAKDALIVNGLVEGHARLLRMGWRAPIATLSLPIDGSAGEPAVDATRDGFLVLLEGWTRPLELFAWDTKKKALVSTGVATTTAADSTGLIAEEVESVSSDGVKVPLSILRRSDAAMDGSHPTLVYGYGGYASSMTPWFSPTLTVWLQRGGVFAVCHVRGGGEKGEAWHVDGQGPRKLNGIRDFIGCAEDLVKKGYTKPSRLAASGGSMGGVLVGRSITERPDLFAAANIDVGMVNPLRILHALNGANQLGELGSPDTPEGAASLLAMDPYQHVEPGVAYPAVLFTVGLNDGRVAPWMSGKMAARLQSATTSGRPVLVRTDRDAGHGINSTRDQVYAERADVWAFLLAAMGDPEFSAH